MTEAPNTENQARSENIKRRLKEFLKDASFGDAKHQAFSDWKSQHQSDANLERARKNVWGRPPSDAASDLRIQEFRRALLDNDMEQKMSSVPGYKHAYWTVWGSFHELGGIFLDRELDDFRNEIEDNLDSRDPKAAQEKPSPLSRP